MTQPSLLPVLDEAQQSTLPLQQFMISDPELVGFAPFYQMFRTLGAVHDPTSFFERLRILLVLLRWPAEAPDILALVRILNIPQDSLAKTLGLLRHDGWLRDDGDNTHYSLTFRGHILAGTLQVLAQPYTEGDVSPVMAGIFMMADQTGSRPELLGGMFDSAIAALEESAREMEALAESEDATRIAQRLRDSARDQRIAGQALDLRKQGAITPDQIDQVQRMHRAILHVSEAAHRLNRRQQELIARDLLAHDLVTLGDIMAWAQQASINDMAEALAGHVRLPFRLLYGGTERQIIESSVEVSGKEPTSGKIQLPTPLPVEKVNINRELSESRRPLHRAQAELRQALSANDPISLPAWVDREEWAAAITHFVAATDPNLDGGSDPIFFVAEPAGKLSAGAKGAMRLVSEGLITRDLAHPEQEAEAHG